jgi:N-acylneuraminate cytidylyltransferase
MTSASLALIPARGGSKRVPRKNIRDFCGKPMIVWSIEAARTAGLFARIVVSTDDAEIAEVARDHGAEVPFVRPAELADDHAGTVPVILHAIRTLEDAGQSFDHVCCIYPAAPLVQPDDLVKGLELLKQGWSFAFSVTSFGSSVHRGLLQKPDGGMEMLFPQYRDTRTQDLPDVFHDAGQFYWGHTKSWLAGEEVYGPTATAVHLPRWRVQDIDTMEDLERAQLLFELLSKHKT